MIDTRIEARRRKDQRSSQVLVRAIKAELQGNRRIQAAEVCSAVESLFAYDLPLIREAWIRMQGWYKDAVDHPPPLARVALATMTAEREDLYRHVPSSGEPIPVEDPPFPFLVNDSIPEDE